MNTSKHHLTAAALLSILLSLGAYSCSPVVSPAPAESDANADLIQAVEDDHGFLSHPDDLTALALEEGELLQVVATTTIAADVISQVGGSHISLIGLFPLGSDPHTYEPTPGDYKTMVDADVILINGVGLEEFLEPVLEEIAPDTPIVSLSENINLIEFGQVEDGDHHDVEHGDTEITDDHEEVLIDDDHNEDDAHDEDHDDMEEAHSEDQHDDDEAEHGHSHEGGYDPHVWFDPNNIILWVETVVETFSTLDPAHAADYQANGARYISLLEELDGWIIEEVSRIPQDDRKLVTDHMAFSYFASRYEFEMVGAVIPAYSTSAQPSAGELAGLIDTVNDLEVQAIFVGTSANPSLAEQTARETGVLLLPLYTGSLSDSDGPAGTYLDLMRYNVSSITTGLAGS